jgi:type VI secretion system protein
VALVLSVTNVERLDNGGSTRMRLDRHGLVIGRSPTVDWCLPDPSNVVSSTHCVIDFQDNAYVLTDKSRNGTYLNDSPERLSAPHVLQSGDTIRIGQYEIQASLDAAAVEAPPPASAPAWEGWGDAPPAAGQSSDGWGPSSSPAYPASPPAQPPASPGWGPTAPQEASPGWGASPSPMAQPAAAPGWGSAPSSEPSSGWGAAPGPAPVQPAAADWGPSAEPAPAASPLSANWAPVGLASQPQPEASVWSDPAAAAPAASAWSSPVDARAAQPSADDIWGRMEASNVVDWARGFSEPKAAPTGADPLGLAPRPNADPLGLAAPTTPLADQRAPAPAPASSSSGWTTPPSAAGTRATPAAPPPLATAPPVAAPASVAAPYPATPQATARPAAAGAEWAAFLAAAGLAPADIKGAPTEVLAAAGAVLRRLVGGVVVMLEARARAKQQLGAQGTDFDRNPLKSARTPDQALAQLLGVGSGAMPAEQAIASAFQDLQAHQMATLAAMQGALRATLDRFAPGAIRARAEDKGVLARILPGAHEAALWKAYEREFEGVARGSDEAFMDVFAKEFRQAYERASAQMQRQS